MKIIDFTHSFTPDMPVYPGDPKATLEQVAFIEKDTFNDHRLITVMHVGTHIDAPLHMIAGGKRVDEIDPSKFIGDGIMLDVRGKKMIDEDSLNGVDLNNNSVVLLYSGKGAEYRKKSYYENIPYLTEGIAKKLASAKIKMAGMDFLGPDPDAPWPAHKILLGAGIMIIENLANLEKLVGVKKFQVIALPAKLQADAAPVRVIAITED